MTLDEWEAEACADIHEFCRLTRQHLASCKDMDIARKVWWELFDTGWAKE